MSRKDSNFIKILTEICAEEEIEIRSFSDYWGHKLYKAGNSAFIVGYQFPLNIASAKEVAQDKVLTYQVLSASNVPAVEHYFYPDEPYMAPESIPDPTFADRLLAKDGVAVLKNNYGTGGSEVYKVASKKEFDEVLSQIHQRSRAAALSPYYQIVEEYRVVMLDGEPQLFFRKERQKTINENGEEVYANWRHNLGQGAVPVVETNESVLEKLENLAKKTVDALQLRFCSVDIIDIGTAYKVLEVNGGVMMENFAGTNDAYYQTAKEIYRKAILRALKKQPESIVCLEGEYDDQL